jgi:PTS system N-acetylgalactosamine-specific IIA component
MSEQKEGGTERPRAIVVGHGEFAGGLVSAVGQICGMADKLVVLSMMVIFTDLPAGSATIAARRIVKDDPSIVLVSGVNLATLLDFVFNNSVSPTEAARAAAERGKASLIVVGR